MTIEEFVFGPYIRTVLPNKCCLSSLACVLSISMFLDSNMENTTEKRTH